MEGYGSPYGKSYTTWMRWVAWVETTKPIGEHVYDIGKEMTEKSLCVYIISTTESHIRLWMISPPTCSGKSSKCLQQRRKHVLVIEPKPELTSHRAPGRGYLSCLGA